MKKGYAEISTVLTAAMALLLALSTMKEYNEQNRKVVDDYLKELDEAIMEVVYVND